MIAYLLVPRRDDDISLSVTYNVKMVISALPHARSMFFARLPTLIVRTRFKNPISIRVNKLGKHSRPILGRYSNL